MNIIVAVDKNWGIGNNNSLLVRIPEDQKFFRSITMNSVLIMGRKTLESFPAGRPLEGRVNIVITHSSSYNAKGVVVVHSVEEAVQEAKKYEKDIFVIGGGTIYEQLLEQCETALVTYIDHTYAADTHFPNLEHNEMWELVEESEEQIYFDLEYYFRKYVRK